MLRESKIRHAFEKKLADELITEAASSFAQAGYIHGDLENIYKSATDFHHQEEWAKDFTDNLLY